MTTSNNKWTSKYKKREHKKAYRQKLANDEYQKRIRGVRLAIHRGIDIAAEAIDVCTRTIRRWLKAYLRFGDEGLKIKSRRPHNIKRLPDEMVAKIIELRDEFEEGCEKIALNLGISSRTVHKVLTAAGLMSERRKRTRWRFYQRKHSNSLWQMDFSCIYDDLWLFLIIDDHSRFIIGNKLMKTPNVADALDRIEQCMGEFGAPKQILTDHGTQFYSSRGGVPKFDMFCLENSIKHILASVKHPQTTGKVERKFGVIKDHLERKGVMASRIEDGSVESIIREFVEYHNYSRYHFTYERYTFGDVEIRRKVAFIPYLRFVCHRY